MCGIHGFNFEDKGLVERMVEVCRHRGPDDSGVLVKNGFSLGNNRLAIIDLSPRGHQPMMSFDGTKIIIFNGEIYNYEILRQELEQKDYKFNSNSDTEVILNLFIAEGERCVEKLNGIFAFAIFDINTKKLFLARDPIGVKPLYYCLRYGKFIFSSEIKAILLHNTAWSLDLESFNHYFRLLYVPEPLTMFEGIRKFPAASYGIFENGQLHLRMYWHTPVGEHVQTSFKQTTETLRAKISDSVREQLISDRPLGIYLSGGIDSSVVLSCAAEHRRNIDTFSVGFELSEDEEAEKFNADFNLARRTAKYFGTNHHEVKVTPQDVVELLPKVIWHLDEPISNPTAIAMMKLADFTKAYATVVLGGDGGDELFGGYDRFRLSLLSSYYRRLPRALRNVLNLNPWLKKLDVPPGIERYVLFMFQKEKILEQTIAATYWQSDVTREFLEHHFFAQIPPSEFDERFLDVYRRTWLQDHSLVLTDKMSMSRGVEARVPLLSREVVEFAARIPLRYKVTPWRTKIILKEAFRNRIPGYLLSQPKRGWQSPAAKWLRRPEVLEMAREVLNAKYYATTAELFRWDEIDRIFRYHYEKKTYNLTILWALLTFQIWSRKYQIHVK